MQTIRRVFNLFNNLDEAAYKQVFTQAVISARHQSKRAM